MPTRPIRFVVAGDVHGHWGRLAEYVAEYDRIYGPLDAVFVTGDTEANRTIEDAKGVVTPRQFLVDGLPPLGDFHTVVSGETVFEVPVYFVAGNHDPYPALDSHGPGEWAPNVYYLGRAGVTTVGGGVNVAFLSGIYSPRISETDRPRLMAKTRTYWKVDELDRIKAESAGRRIDLLLTHDWPSGSGVRGIIDNAGSEHMTDLVKSIGPRVHACGHKHINHRGKVGSTSLAALGAIRHGDTGVTVFEKNARGTIRELATPSLADALSQPRPVPGVHLHAIA